MKDWTLLKLYARPLTQFIPAPRRVYLVPSSGPQGYREEATAPWSIDSISIDIDPKIDPAKLEGNLRIKTPCQVDFPWCPAQRSGISASTVFCLSWWYPRISLVVVLAVKKVHCQSEAKKVISSDFMRSSTR